MSSLRTLDEVESAPTGGRVVGIGVFDGVHLGHQEIVSEVVATASAMSALPTVVTFYPHPAEVLGSGPGPGLLTLPERRAGLLDALGVGEVVAVQFDRQFAQLLPEEFCDLVLSSRLGAKLVLVGANFRFGRNGAGDLHDLETFGRSHGFAVRAVDLVTLGGEPVSSTRIRAALRQGEVAMAAGLLGRPHRLEGTVIKGVGRGRGLKAPTANLAVSGGLVVPKDGVYVTATTVTDSGRRYESVTSVGTNPTFKDEEETRVETLVIGYEGDLYGCTLMVDFLERLRPQVEFEDAEALALQIQKDVQAALEVHARFDGGLGA